jgi:hypothetical protein
MPMAPAGTPRRGPRGQDLDRHAADPHRSPQGGAACLAASLLWPPAASSSREPCCPAAAPPAGSRGDEPGADGTQLGDRNALHQHNRRPHARGRLVPQPPAHHGARPPAAGRTPRRAVPGRTGQARPGQARPGQAACTAARRMHLHSTSHTSTHTLGPSRTGQSAERRALATRRHPTARPPRRRRCCRHTWTFAPRRCTRCWTRASWASSSPSSTTTAPARGSRCRCARRAGPGPVSPRGVGGEGAAAAGAAAQRPAWASLLYQLLKRRCGPARGGCSCSPAAAPAPRRPPPPRR